MTNVYFNNEINEELYDYNNPVSDEIVYEYEDTFNYDEDDGDLEDLKNFLSNFRSVHEKSGTCTIEEWDEYSDIYKDVYGIRPRYANFNII